MPEGITLQIILFFAVFFLYKAYSDVRKRGLADERPSVKMN
jgi:hypothetical protein